MSWIEDNGSHSAADRYDYERGFDDGADDRYASVPFGFAPDMAENDDYVAGYEAGYAEATREITRDSN